MELKPYPEYKETGVEWIEEIPEEWELTKLKYLSEDISDGDWVEFKDQVEFGNYKLIQLKNIGIGEFKPEIDKEITSDFFIKNNCRPLKNKDLIIARIPHPILRAFVFSKQLGKCISVVDATIVTPIINKISSKFLCYFFNSDYGESLGESLTNGATRLRITRDSIQNIEILYPKSLKEQSAITTFLDNKTAQIDELIAKNRRLIELLKEKQTTLMNHTVTKGLDPNVKMKYSGVEWIGEIPITADIISFKRFCNLNQGLQFPQSERLEEPRKDSMLYITIKYLHTKDKIEEYIPNPSKNVICTKDDILLARTGATGEVITNIQGVFHNNFFKINYNNNITYKDYLIYYLKLPSVKHILLLKAGVTTIPDLNHDDFLNTPFIRYNYEKQKEIVKYLDKKIMKINDIIHKVENKIELLDEYRKSLIHHIVIGKYDVRGVEV